MFGTLTMAFLGGLFLLGFGYVVREIIFWITPVVLPRRLWAAISGFLMMLTGVMGLDLLLSEGSALINNPPILFFVQIGLVAAFITLCPRHDLDSGIVWMRH